MELFLLSLQFIIKLAPNVVTDLNGMCNRTGIPSSVPEVAEYLV